MKHSLQHGHFAVWSVLVLVFGLALVCPVLAQATDVSAWGGNGGEKFRDECPKGSYLVGVKGRAGEWVDRIAPICAPWLPAKQTFGTPRVGSFHGTSRGGVERERICWGLGVNNRVVQSWEVIRLRSDNFVQYIKGYCISLAPPAATGKWIFGGPIPDEGDSDGPLGGQGRDYLTNLGCPAGEESRWEFMDAQGFTSTP